MRQQIDVLALEPGAYAATVTEGENTTHHRVVLRPGFLDDLAIVDLDERALVTEILDYLLERQPAAALPHDIDPDAMSRHDDEMVYELQLRLAP